MSCYDAMGLRRMLLEWATAAAQRRAFDDRPGVVPANSDHRLML